MDCSNKRSKPPSLRPLLYKQFKEQSSLCDVTIKVGLWEKRFHWCVLVASPFFENIYRNNFLEKQTGNIELSSKWPPSLVELTLLFLYGKKPKVTEANVDKLLDIAEFLVIPGLKVAGIDFLKRTKVTLDNCTKMLELSSTYDFELKRCSRFILGRLPEVLEQEGMLNVTAEWIKMLLADPTLRYVPVQKWFNFLIRWVQNAQERQNNFSELFSMLDFSECDRDFINNIVAKDPLVIKANIEMENVLTTVLDGTKDTVIIFSNTDPLICLNMRTMLWYRINSTEISDMVQDGCQRRRGMVVGVQGRNSSCIYKVCKMAYYMMSANDLDHIHTHDLSNGHSLNAQIVFKPTDDEDDTAGDNCSSYALSNDLLAAVSRNDGTNTSSVLFIGSLNEPVTEMQAILTLKNHSVSTICCSENGSIALLSSDKDSLFIFNEPTSELECIQLKTNFGIEGISQSSLVGSKDGFILYDTNNVVCISKPSGACATKYLVTPMTWSKHDASHVQEYVFDGDHWFRYKYNWHCSQSVSHEASIEYASHTDLISVVHTAFLPWRNIPIPSKEFLLNLFGAGNAFAVSLPIGVTRCHLDCPHCKMPKNNQLHRRSFSDSDKDDSDYMYDSSERSDRCICSRRGYDCCSCCCCNNDEEFEDEYSEDSSRSDYYDDE